MALEIGAGILGTGGGGNPYLVRLRALELLESGHRMELLPLAALSRRRAGRLARRHRRTGGRGGTDQGRGGRGSRAACARDAPRLHRERAGLPRDRRRECPGTADHRRAGGYPGRVVDGDGMGRAFPEIQMTHLLDLRPHLHPLGHGRPSRQRGRLRRRRLRGLPRTHGARPRRGAGRLLHAGVRPDERGLHPPGRDPGHLHAGHRPGPRRAGRPCGEAGSRRRDLRRR